MEKESLSFRRVFSIFLSSLVLISCGGKTLGNYDILKFEGEASGEEIPIATYEQMNVVFAYKVANSSRTEAELYVALDYDSNVQARHSLKAVDNYCLFFLESEEGAFQSADGTFEYKASLNVEEGTASSISEAVASIGTVTGQDTTFVEGFLDAAAEGIKDYVDTYREQQSHDEEWLVERLEFLGYVLNSNYDRDSLDYMENKILEDHGINVTVKKRYVGYINQSERYVEIIIFGSEEECARYFYKVWAPGQNKEYNYHAHNREIYFFTSSYETIQQTYPSPYNQP